MFRQRRNAFAIRKSLGFIVLVAVVAGGLLYGVRGGSWQREPLTTPAVVLSDEVLTVHGDGPIPTCNAKLAIETVQGQLLRVSRGARVIGLSNVAQTGRTRAGGLACAATANLDAGTRTVTYTIDLDASGREGWVIVVRR